MNYTAYISGLSVEFNNPIVESEILKQELMKVAGVRADCKGDDPFPHHYFLPRQNKPNGITGDGPFCFDLRECNDFILVSVRAGYHCSGSEGDDRLIGLNMYGLESKT